MSSCLGLPSLSDQVSIHNWTDLEEGFMSMSPEQGIALLPSGVSGVNKRRISPKVFEYSRFRLCLC